MAPSSMQQVLLSPAELSYLHTSLSSTPPIRPDGRSSSQFRTLIAETGILLGTNGSARICFADGTEAVVGIKAEVEKSGVNHNIAEPRELGGGDLDNEHEPAQGSQKGGIALNEWIELSIEIPGLRDDDTMPTFLAAMLSEALLADTALAKKLWINSRFHWKLYLDILLVSQPLSYPLPLLSLTTHLALLSTRLPRMKSKLEEDPLFDDDWEAAIYLHHRNGVRSRPTTKPPITLLVMAVEENIIFDPTAEELAVADSVIALSIGEDLEAATEAEDAMDVDRAKVRRRLRLLAIRTIDPPSRLTHSGIPNAMNTAVGGLAADSMEKATLQRETMDEEGVWQPRRGGMKRKLVASMVQKVLERGGVAEEVLDGLEAVELG